MPQRKGAERTPAQKAAFERMREANRQKILAEAGVTQPPADPPPDDGTKPTYRARSSSGAAAPAKPRAKAGTQSRSKPKSARTGSSSRGRKAPAASPAPSPPAAAPSSSGGGFWQGLREGLGT